MQSLQQIIETKLLPYVEKPAQYIGDEYNSLVGDWEQTANHIAFCFPDTYEIGMSHLGLRVLYHVMNSQPNCLMERVFVPLNDAQAIMHEQQIPLFSWESKRALKDFDMLAFTLQYEMSYSNILLMLSLAGFPLRAAERDDSFAPVIAGGSGAYNPEPLACFFDLFVLGEGEDVFPEIVNLWQQTKAQGKKVFLQQAALIEGVYVPSLYVPCYDDSKNLFAIVPQNGAPPIVKKRVVADMNTAPFPTADLVPFVQIVHDRLTLEVMRGCNRGCRFCQAGIIFRPVREKNPELLLEQARELIATSGYDEIGMISLSTADYSCVGQVIGGLMSEHAASGVSVSLPSLRADAFSIDLANQVQQVRKSGLTFAPEAGTQRLRDVINKGVTEQDIMQAAEAAFANGWSSIKLYFMMGLPTETQQDLDGIYDLAQKLVYLYRRTPYEGKRKGLSLSVSVAVFVPKPHTPFQWYGQTSRAEIIEKTNYLRDKFRSLKQARLSCHETNTSFLEAAFARGDRRLGDVLERAFELGCKFDGWHEHFRYDLWQQAFSECGLTIEEFANRTYERDDVLPWQVLSCGVDVNWLWQEWQAAQEEKITPDCVWGGCTGCGVCDELGVDNMICAAGSGEKPNSQPASSAAEGEVQA